MEKPERRVFEIIEENRDQMICHLQELVRIDTQTPPGHDYDKVCGLMAEKLDGLGCEVTIHEAAKKYLELSGAKLMGLEGPRSNIVARLKGSGKGPTLHISAHIDTAAIQKEGWTKSPLGGEVTKTTSYSKSPYDKGSGYIWGRGVSDDKGEATVMTYALQAILEAGVKLRGNLILTGNCDEEIGGVAGLGYLIKEGIVKADYGIQLDGGFNGIGLAAQGRTRFLIRTHGKSYHGQIPILGINAIEKMSKINVALNDYWRNVLLKRQVSAPGIELPKDLRKIGLSSFTAMLNIGTIKGGVQGATVPDLCEEETLRGMVPGETFDEVKKEFISVIEGVKATDADLRYDVEVINAREGYVVPATDPYALKAQAIIAEVVGRKLPFTGTLASTDMNYQVINGGMPCVNFGVGGPYCNGHKQDENASIDEIIECTKATALIMMRVLGTV